MLAGPLALWEFRVGEEIGVYNILVHVPVA